MRLLVVEDDRQLGPLLVKALRDEGHAVDLCRTVLDADHAFASTAYDLVVLDLGLPDGDGVDVCRRWRDADEATPVLMLTARDATPDKVIGLDAGADDYLSKPFDMAELGARVRALLRRPSGVRRLRFVIDDLDLDPAERRVRRAGVTIPLTAREFSVLHYLMSRAGEVVGAIAGATAASYWLAGRALGPARAAMAQQRDFITDAAHELRTPLSVIQAAASHALLRDRDAAAYRESLADVRTAAERAKVGVDELLELARLQAGQVTLRTAPLRLDLLMEEVAAGIRVDGCVVEAPVGDPTVIEADYGLLRQAIETVARNAASRATKVFLRTESRGNEAVVVVSDNGSGFPEALLGSAAFERFLRGDSKGSTGLGMAIAARIVGLHQGRCEAANPPEGGAEVRFFLPR